MAYEDDGRQIANSTDQLDDENTRQVMKRKSRGTKKDDSETGATWHAWKQEVTGDEDVQRG